MIGSNIPAGLLCENSEIFSKHNISYALVKGTCVPFADFPEYLLTAIDNSITATDHICLTEMNMIDNDDRRQKWISCNVSELDNTPDYIVGQKTLTREYVNCPERGKCKQEGRLCLTLPQSTGLTKTQLIVLSHIRDGLLNKEIASRMGISIHTVNTHTKNLQKRTGLTRKADMSRYAQEMNLF